MSAYDVKLVRSITKDELVDVLAVIGSVSKAVSGISSGSIIIESAVGPIAEVWWNPVAEEWLVDFIRPEERD